MFSVDLMCVADRRTLAVVGNTDITLEAEDDAEPCYACGSSVSRRRIGIHHVYVCGRCGMGAIRQPPASKDYWTRGESELEETYWGARRALFESALRHLAAQGVSGTVLDFGGGVGHFSECALAMGWDAYSLDSSELAVDAAAQRLGGDRSLSTEHIPRFTSECDLVTLWCVLAHVPDPLNLLTQALDLLKPGGRLLLTTPNFLFQSAYARILARLGRPLDFVAHDHLLHFTPAALDELLRKAGYAHWSYEYLGVTEECVVDRSLAGALVPLKKAWNRVGLHTKAIGLPPLCAELQVIAEKPAPFPHL